jgi:two-component system, NarL family, nitrate/nitrite response regulator NarL
VNECSDRRRGVGGGQFGVAKVDTTEALGGSFRNGSYRVANQENDGLTSDSMRRDESVAERGLLWRASWFIGLSQGRCRLRASFAAVRSGLGAWMLAGALALTLNAEPTQANVAASDQPQACAAHSEVDASLVGDTRCHPASSALARLPAGASILSLAKARPASGRKPRRRFSRQARSESANGLGKVPTVLVEECTLFREGLKLILVPTPFQVTASAACLDELASLHSRGGDCRLLLVGTGEDHAAGAQRIRSALKHFPSALCVVLSDRYDPQAVNAAMDAGAVAYLLKSNGKDALVKALEMVMLGSTVLPTPSRRVEGSNKEEERPSRGTETSAPDTLHDELTHHLSTREIDTLYGLHAGHSNKLIAREFAIAEATVKVHVKAILRKIRVANRTQAAIWAMQHLPHRPASAVRIDPSMEMNGMVAMTPVNLLKPSPKAV